MDKREVRSGIVDSIPGSKVALLIIFRGGWIDAITSCPADEAESLLACLIGSKHMEEIRKVSIGDRISSLLGSKKAVLEQRLRKLGKEIGPISKRDLEQAQIIFKGLGEYFDRKKGDLTI